ncbi:hypothetical protein NN561_013869 [Cricetulus griseus]
MASPGGSCSEQVEPSGSPPSRSAAVLSLKCRLLQCSTSDWEDDKSQDQSSCYGQENQKECSSKFKRLKPRCSLGINFTRSSAAWTSAGVLPHFIEFLDFFLILLHRFHSLAEGCGLLDERLCFIIMVPQPLHKGFGVSKCLLNRAAHFSVPGARARSSSVPLSRRLRARETPGAHGRPRAPAVPAVQRADAQRRTHRRGCALRQPARLGPIPGRPGTPLPCLQDIYRMPLGRSPEQLTKGSAAGTEQGRARVRPGRAAVLLVQELRAGSRLQGQGHGGPRSCRGTPAALLPLIPLSLLQLRLQMLGAPLERPPPASTSPATARSATGSLPSLHPGGARTPGRPRLAPHSRPMGTLRPKVSHLDAEGGTAESVVPKISKAKAVSPDY